MADLYGLMGKAFRKYGEINANSHLGMRADRPLLMALYFKCLVECRSPVDTRNEQTKVCRKLRRTMTLKQTSCLKAPCGLRIDLERR
jgi:hypothetical protein